MGCIFSIFKKDNDRIVNTDTLIVTKHCFVCNKVFSNNIEYNRHIPKCNKLYRKK